MTEPCDLDATEARARIGRKRLSASDLLESCIARRDALDQAVNAIVANDDAQARERAREADEAVARGRALPLLHGLPVAIKDTDNVGGMRTTYGSPLFRDHVPDLDDGFVARLRGAGAIIAGKTNVPEWAAGANTRNSVYGVTGNPFDPSKSAAGSSGGSAAALATGMVPLATGSDLGGSLRNPAAFCGVVGFRPSPGVVAAERRLFGWNPLVVLGPMARNVRDLCLLLAGMAGEDARDPLKAGSVEYARLPWVDLASLRVALTADFGSAPTERHIAEVFAEKTALFRDVFASAVDAAPDCAGADEAFEILRALGFLGDHLQKVQETPELVGPNIRANVADGLRYSAADVARALAAQTAQYRRWGDFFQRHDLLLTPAITISPRDWTELYPAEIDGQPTRTYFHWLSLAYVVSLAGHPALSLPVGRDRNGMPFGLQIVGPAGGDALVLAAAAALETLLAQDERTARPVPDLARLSAGAPLREAAGFMGFGGAGAG